MTEHAAPFKLAFLLVEASDNEVKQPHSHNDVDSIPKHPAKADLEERLKQNGQQRKDDAFDILFALEVVV